MRRNVRRGGERGLDLARILRRIDHRRALRILEDVLVILGAPKRVDWNRDDARLDRAPEHMEELGGVLDDHDDPLTPANAKAAQQIAATIDVLG